jgi:glycosyltransferase involved in cell wall biosynthesis
MLYVPKVLKCMDGYWLYRSVLGKLRALKQDGRLDVIDAHFGYPDGVGCVRAARELGIPVFITIRGVEVDQLQTSVIGYQVRRAIDQADGCITVSHSLKTLITSTGARAENVRVIHNAVDRHVFQNRDKAAARQRLNVAVDVPLIVSVGNLLSVKGHHTLISAFAELTAHKPKAHLVIIGGPMHEPQYPHELGAQCERLSVADRVTFAGKLEPSEVASWLNASDLFALASKREGCCNAVLEALACGAPVVTTPAGDNDWFVKDGDNGYIVPVGDCRAMAGALLAGIGRTDWDRDRISAGLQVGDWNAVAGEVLEFFSERTERRLRDGTACGNST